MHIRRSFSLFTSTLGLQSAFAATITGHHIECLDRIRHFYVTQPLGLSETLRPVVILLHGHGESGALMLGQETIGGYRSLDWIRLAANKKVILFASEGIKASDGKQSWNDCRADAITNAASDDIGFLSALIDCAISEFGADPRRIYIFGSSNGGGMALRAGIELGPRLAAIGVQSSLMAAHSNCKLPTHPLPVFFSHGTADKIAPYEGGAIGGFGITGRGNGLSINDSIAIWRSLAGLEDTPMTYRFPHLQTSDPTRATRLTWGDDPTQLQIELLRIDGGGHTASSHMENHTMLLRKLKGEMNHDMDTPEAAWRFFDQKRARQLKNDDSSVAKVRFESNLAVVS